MTTTSRQFIIFIFVGILNTVFGYAIFALLLFLGLHYTIAILLATFVGVFFNFKTIGKLVFQSHDNSLIIRFFGVYLIIYLLNIGSLYLLKGILNKYVAEAIALPVLALFSFFLNKKLVFQNTKVE